MSKDQNPFISFVVLSWNTAEDTKAAIQSIRNQEYKNFEIVVVDNGSIDGSKEWLSKQKGIVYVDLPKNTGFTGGEIAAEKVAKGEFLALINSDAVIAKNWCTIALSQMKDPKVAVVGGRCYTWNDGEEPFNTENKFYSYQVVDSMMGYARTLQTGTQTCEVDSISGAGVLIRRSALKEVGYFDDTFFAYYEETDLFARLKRAGHKIMYEPSAHTWHKIGASSKGETTKKSYSYFYLYQMQRNRFLFAIKNYDSKEARIFFRRYTKSAIKAHYLYLKYRSPEHKAQVKAFWWNITNLPKTYQKRRSIKNLGESYSKLLSGRTLSSDITVVMPCYNYADFVGEAIDSLLAQTLRPARIIVINDGSTDDSLKEIMKYKDSVEIIDQENAGVVATKNRGLSMVTTTWTAFFDADDIMQNTYLEDVLAKAQSQLAEITYTDMQYFGARNGVHKARKFSMGSLLRSNYIHNSALISTDRLIEIGGYKQEMAGGYEDWELYISLAETGAKFAYLPKANFLYRQRSQSRNVEAEEKADKLNKTVRALHTPTYRHYQRSFKSYELILSRLISDPFVLIVAVYSLPLSLLSGVRGFFVTGKKSYAYRLRNYLHNRDEKRREDEI